MWLSLFHDYYICVGDLISVQAHIRHIVFLLLIVCLGFQQHVARLIQVITLGRQGEVVGPATGRIVLQTVSGQLRILMHVG
jgi:hypothetical protein